MSEIDRLAAEIGDARVRRVFVELGDRSAVRWWDRRCASRLAAQLLQQRVPRRAIVERLQASCPEFSERTFYTIIEECLKLRRSGGDFANDSGTIESQTMQSHRSNE